MAHPCNSGSNKMLVWGKRTILGRKMTHPHNFGLDQRAFYKFYRMNWANSALEFILMAYTKKTLFGGKWAI